MNRAVEPGDELEIGYGRLRPSRWRVDAVEDDGSFWVRREEPSKDRSGSTRRTPEGPTVELLGVGWDVEILSIDEASEAETLDQPLAQEVFRERTSFRARVTEEREDASGAAYRLEPAAD